MPLGYRLIRALSRLLLRLFRGMEERLLPQQRLQTLLNEAAKRRPIGRDRSIEMLDQPQVQLLDLRDPPVEIRTVEGGAQGVALQPGADFVGDALGGGQQIQAFLGQRVENENFRHERLQTEF